MKSLTKDELFSLEQYAAARDAFRARVRLHKRHRALAIGSAVRLLFEDRLTIQYQVQEMLRIERIFEPAGIAEELDAYNPLIPDGRNLKATMLIEFPETAERRRQLAQLVGIERHVWLQVDTFARIYAVADEDLERTDDAKTSAVHFLRFEFDDGMVDALRDGRMLAAGVDHAHYNHQLASLPAAMRQSLVADFA